MTTVSLYRRYRPQTFSEVIGQALNVQIISNILKSQAIPHAYLFSGPRGSGKTSLARLFAKGLNCEQGISPKVCNRCAACTSIREGHALDVIEMDAASSRGVEDIRDLREKVKFASSSFRYKVYILDEVHMLTKEAFNAFLKTLEEPPPHTIFILATTDPQRVPATVQSRCLKMEFRPLSLEDIQKGLQRVVKKEKIKLTQDAAQRIAFSADGSLRDALSLLEQLIGLSEEITLEEVNRLLGWVSDEETTAICRALSAGEVASLIQFLTQLLGKGKDTVMIVRLLIKRIKENYLASIEKKEQPFASFARMELWLRELAKCEYWLRTERLPTILLETTLLKLCRGKVEPPPPNRKPVRSEHRSTEAKQAPVKEKVQENPVPPTKSEKTPVQDLKDLIPDEILATFFQENPALAIPYLLAQKIDKGRERWSFTFGKDQHLAWRLARQPRYADALKKIIAQKLGAAPELIVLPEELAKLSLSPSERVLTLFPGAKVLQ